jgi:hypothetical protein
VTALSRDCRLGLRLLARSPGLAATVVFTLALGIGASTAVLDRDRFRPARAPPVSGRGPPRVHLARLSRVPSGRRELLVSRRPGHRARESDARRLRRLPGLRRDGSHGGSRTGAGHGQLDRARLSRAARPQTAARSDLSPGRGTGTRAPSPWSFSRTRSGGASSEPLPTCSAARSG